MTLDSCCGIKSRARRLGCEVVVVANETATVCGVPRLLLFALGSFQLSTRAPKTELEPGDLATPAIFYLYLAFMPGEVISPVCCRSRCKMYIRALALPLPGRSVNYIR